MGFRLPWSTAAGKLARRGDAALQLFLEGAVLKPPADLHGFFNLSDRIVLVERFLRRPALNNALDTFTASVANTELVAALVANKDFELLGTGASADDVTFDPEGGILLTTDSSASQQCIILPHLSTNQSAWSGITWGTDQETWWKACLKTGAADGDVVWAGLKLTNTSVIATDADQAFFRGATGENWNAVYSIGGTDVAVDTGVDMAVATVYDMAIIIDADRIARFYINGDLVATSTALTDAIDLIPYVGITGNAKTLTIRHMAISRLAA